MDITSNDSALCCVISVTSLVVAVPSTAMGGSNEQLKLFHRKLLKINSHVLGISFDDINSCDKNIMTMIFSLQGCRDVGKRAWIPCLSNSSQLLY